MILLLFGSLKPHQTFRTSGLRIAQDMLDRIVCTNVAESGVTVPNVGLVISSGVHRGVSTDVRTGSPANALQTLSKAQLLQQLGRTGRTDCGIHITMMSHDQ